MRRLPSAAELLGKSHKAAFLAHAREPPPPAAAAAGTVEETKKSEAQSRTEAGAASGQPERDASWTPRQAETLAVESVSRGKRKESVSTQEKGTKKDLNSAKERVKRQRLRGQAGIGSDFRTWKSEEEMRMRQQFDT